MTHFDVISLPKKSERVGATKGWSSSFSARAPNGIGKEHRRVSLEQREKKKREDFITRVKIMLKEE